tara:strand:+ start:648 stop:1028 length:381 start_codon:yes stop_codon:yes gene_type:complete
MLEVALVCLASAIYHEARGEPLLGQMAVAEVIINRVDNWRWKNTVCEVVTQKDQFTFYWDGKSDKMIDHEARRLAERVATSYLVGGNAGITKGATCYTRVEINNYWTKKSTVIMTIGKHKFMDCTT